MAVAPTGVSTAPLRYAALGDSYGVAPVDPTSPECLRSTVNHPHLIASRTGAALADVTCGAAVRAVKAKAPKARVAILSSPWITPYTGGCFPVLPIARGDVPYLRHLQMTLNDAVRRAHSGRTRSTST